MKERRGEDMNDGFLCVVSYVLQLGEIIRGFTMTGGHIAAETVDSIRETTGELAAAAEEEERTGTPGRRAEDRARPRSV